jgi:hypothetical protein
VPDGPLFVYDVCHASREEAERRGYAIGLPHLPPSSLSSLYGRPRLSENMLCDSTDWELIPKTSAPYSLNDS